MTITITDASIYTMQQGKEVAFELAYSEGTRVRAVKSAGRTIRCEAMQQGKWVQTHRPYVICHSRKRNAERIADQVESFLA